MVAVALRLLLLGSLVLVAPPRLGAEPVKCDPCPGRKPPPPAPPPAPGPLEVDDKQRRESEDQRLENLRKEVFQARSEEDKARFRRQVLRGRRSAVVELEAFLRRELERRGERPWLPAMEASHPEAARLVRSLDRSGLAAERDRLARELEDMARERVRVAKERRDAEKAADPRLAYLATGLSPGPEGPEAGPALEAASRRREQAAGTLAEAERKLQELGAPDPKDPGSDAARARVLAELGVARIGLDLAEGEVRELGLLARRLDLAREEARLETRLGRVRRIRDLLAEVARELEAAEAARAAIRDLVAARDDLEAGLDETERAIPETEQKRAEAEARLVRIKEGIDGLRAERRQALAKAGAEFGKVLGEVGAWLAEQLVAIARAGWYGAEFLVGAPHATPGYLLELFRSLAMTALNIAGDVVLAAFPITGIVVGVAVGVVDTLLLQPQTLKQVVEGGLEVSVHLPAPAAGYYLGGVQGDRDDLEAFEATVRRLDQVVASVDRGYRDTLEVLARQLARGEAEAALVAVLGKDLEKIRAGTDELARQVEEHRQESARRDADPRLVRHRELETKVRQRKASAFLAYRRLKAVPAGDAEAAEIAMSAWRTEAEALGKLLDELRTSAHEEGLVEAAHQAEVERFELEQAGLALGLGIELLEEASATVAGRIERIRAREQREASGEDDTEGPGGSDGGDPGSGAPPATPAGDGYGAGSADLGPRAVDWRAFWLNNVVKVGVFAGKKLFEAVGEPTPPFDGEPARPPDREEVRAGLEARAADHGTPDPAVPADPSGDRGGGRGRGGAGAGTGGSGAGPGSGGGGAGGGGGRVAAAAASDGLAIPAGNRGFYWPGGSTVDADRLARLPSTSSAPGVISGGEIRRLKGFLESLPASGPAAVTREVKDAFAAMGGMKKAVKAFTLPAEHGKHLAELRQELIDAVRARVVERLHSEYGPAAAEGFDGWLNTGSAARRGNPSFKFAASDADSTAVGHRILHQGESVDLSERAVALFYQEWEDIAGFSPGEIDVTVFPMVKFMEIQAARSPAELVANDLYAHLLQAADAEAYTGRGALEFVKKYTRDSGSFDRVGPGRTLVKDPAAWVDPGRGNPVSPAMDAITRKIGWNPPPFTPLTNWAISANELGFLSRHAAELTGADAAVMVQKYAKYPARSGLTVLGGPHNADWAMAVLSSRLKERGGQISESVEKAAEAWRKAGARGVFDPVRAQKEAVDRIFREVLAEPGSTDVGRALKILYSGADPPGNPAALASDLGNRMLAFCERNLANQFGDAAGDLQKMLSDLGVRVNPVTGDLVGAEARLNAMFLEVSSILGNVPEARRKDLYETLLRRLPPHLASDPALSRFLDQALALSGRSRTALAREVETEIRLLSRGKPATEAVVVVARQRAAARLARRLQAEVLETTERVTRLARAMDFMRSDTFVRHLRLAANKLDDAGKRVSRLVRVLKPFRDAVRQGGAAVRNAAQLQAEMRAAMAELQGLRDGLAGAFDQDLAGFLAQLEELAGKALRKPPEAPEQLLSALARLSTPLHRLLMEGFEVGAAEPILLRASAAWRRGMDAVAGLRRSGSALVHGTVDELRRIRSLVEGWVVPVMEELDARTPRLAKLFRVLGEDVLSLGLNLLFGLLDLYSVLDPFPPCIPDQALLPCDGGPVQVFAASFDPWVAWIRVEDQGSGVNPASFSAKVVDRTDGAVLSEDLYAPGTRLRRELGQRPFEDGGRGPSLVVLAEEVFAHRAFSTADLVERVAAKALGWEPASGGGDASIMWENRIGAARLKLEVPMKGRENHELELTLGIRDRSGRAAMARKSRVRVVLDDTAPRVGVRIPAVGQAFAPGDTRIVFEVEDPPGRTPGAVASGIETSGIELILLSGGRPVSRAHWYEPGKGPDRPPAPGDPPIVASRTLGYLAPGLPEGAYGLLVVVRDRAGNTSVNGEAIVAGADPMSRSALPFRVGSGKPLRILAQARVDSPIAPGTAIPVSLSVMNATGSELQIESGGFRVVQAERTSPLAPAGVEAFTRRRFEFPRRLGPGSVVAVGEADLVAESRYRAEEEVVARFGLAGAAKVRGLAGELEAEGELSLMFPGPRASSRGRVVGSAAFLAPNGDKRPLPLGTEIHLTQIYEFPTVTLGSAGALAPGEQKLVEHVVGTGRIGNDGGGFSLDFVPASGRAGRFRLVAWSRAEDSRPDLKGKAGSTRRPLVAAVSGFRTKVPFRIVSQPLELSAMPGPEGERTWRGDFEFPGPGTGVPLPYEGDLTTGGEVSPWSRDPVVGAGSMGVASLATVMSDMSRMATQAGSGATGALQAVLLHRNPTGAFAVLATLVRAHGFLRDLEILPADSSRAVLRVPGFLPFRRGAMPPGMPSAEDPEGEDGAREAGDPEAGGHAEQAARDRVRSEDADRLLAERMEVLERVRREVDELDAELRRHGVEEAREIEEARRVEADKLGHEEELARVRADLLDLAAARDRLLPAGTRVAADDEDATARAEALLALGFVIRAREGEETLLVAAIAATAARSGELATLQEELRARADALRARREEAGRRLAEAAAAADQPLERPAVPGFALGPSGEGGKDREEETRARFEFWMSELGRKALGDGGRLEPFSIPGREGRGFGLLARWEPAAKPPGFEEDDPPRHAKGRDGERGILVPGGGSAWNDEFGIARAVAAWVRERLVGEAAGPGPGYRLLARHHDPVWGPTEAAAEAFDQFLAAAMLERSAIPPRVEGEPGLDFERLRSVLSGDSRKGADLEALRSREDVRGMCNPAALATLYHCLYQAHGRDFLANLLGARRLVAAPRWSGVYPEAADDLLLLGLLPEVRLVPGSRPGEAPVVEVRENGVLGSRGRLPFVLELDAGPGFEAPERLPIAGGKFSFSALGPGQDPVGLLRTDRFRGRTWFRVAVDATGAPRDLEGFSTPPGVIDLTVPETRVGAQGGTVRSAATGIGARFVIPPGALAGPTAIATGTLTVPGEVGGFRPVGDTVFRFEAPEGMTRVAELEIRCDPATLRGVETRGLTIARFDPGTGTFEPIPTSIDPVAGIAVAHPSHTSLFALVEDTRPPVIEVTGLGPSPVADGEAASVSIRASESVTLALRLLDEAGRELAQAGTLADRSRPGSWLWEGSDAAGRRVPDGIYRLEAVGTDASGKRSQVVTASLLVWNGARAPAAFHVVGPAAEPLAGASVSIEGVSRAATSGADGWARFDAVPVGSRWVTTRRTGYFPDRIMVEIGKSPGDHPVILERTGVKGVRVAPARLDPAGGGRFRVEAEVVRVAEYRVQVVDGEGRVRVELAAWSRRGPGPLAVDWDGRTADGEIVRGPVRIELAARVEGEVIPQASLEVFVDTGLAEALVVDPEVLGDPAQGADPEVRVGFRVVGKGRVRVSVRDRADGELAVLCDGPVEEGIQGLVWNGLDSRGEPVPDGSYRVTVDPVAADGYASRRLEAGLRIDRAVPRILEILPASGSVVTTGMPGITARFEASPGDVEAHDVRIQIDDQPAIPDSVDLATGRVAYRPKTALAAGVHVAVVLVRDRAGNEAAPRATAFHVAPPEGADRGAPRLEVEEPAAGGVVHRVEGALRVKARDPESGIDPRSFRLWIDGELRPNAVTRYIPGTSGKPWDLYQYDVALLVWDGLEGVLRYQGLTALEHADQPESTHSYRLEVEDLAGNPAAVEGVFRLVPDRAAPEFVSVAPEADSVVAVGPLALEVRLRDRGRSGLDPGAVRVLFDGEAMDPASQERWWELVPPEGAREGVATLAGEPIRGMSAPGRSERGGSGPARIAIGSPSGLVAPRAFAAGPDGSSFELSVEGELEVRSGLVGRTWIVRAGSGQPDPAPGSIVLAWLGRQEPLPESAWDRGRREGRARQALVLGEASPVRFEWSGQAWQPVLAVRIGTGARILEDASHLVSVQAWDRAGNGMPARSLVIRGRGEAP